MADFSRTLHRVNSCRAHRLIFRRGSSFSAADDCSSVTHAASWRRGLTSYESDDGLSHIFLNVFRGDFFGVSTDFTDQDDGVGIRIFVEHAHGIEKAGADDRIAADSYAGGLPDAKARELIDSFVS